jgi:hypothetical protein
MTETIKIWRAEPLTWGRGPRQFEMFPAYVMWASSNEKAAGINPGAWKIWLMVRILTFGARRDHLPNRVGPGPR